MAKLGVEVNPGGTVRNYSIFVDGVPPEMGTDHRGESLCSGRCGDGSRHTLLYSFNGAPGSTLRVTLRCAGRILCRLGELRIADTGRPWHAGRVTFVL